VVTCASQPLRPNLWRQRPGIVTGFQTCAATGLHSITRESVSSAKLTSFAGRPVSARAFPAACWVRIAAAGSSRTQPARGDSDLGFHRGVLLKFDVPEDDRKGRISTLCAIP
jgi:hypothetical protein